ncbi:Stromal membrane-associated protein 2 [Seminavis robusta]|uniref:Stromal membrane-associated protein 2 n=1 Tax=Seminavis robusta TaxID=568900 RepID=A0A9N8DSN1_9STRA|nr:Stromal membrane-associated protein 2 [Seminavis robusta]|eukprot:Sro252_g099640.1 Stromal membrane-associated protein 2 (950) ;mRNA; r:40322-43288
MTGNASEDGGESGATTSTCVGPSMSLPDRLKAVLEKEGNETCAECPEASPTWACLLTNPLDDGDGKKVLAIFCCYKCYGAHFQLGKDVGQVKSTRRANDWKEEEIEILEASGNKIVNDIYEFKLTPEDKQKEHGEDKDTFVKNKYQNMLYFSKRAFQQFQKGHSTTTNATGTSFSFRLPGRSVSSHDGKRTLMTPSFDWVSFSKATPSNKEMEEQQADDADQSNLKRLSRRGLTKAFSNPFALESMRRTVSGEQTSKDSSSSKLEGEDKKESEDCDGSDNSQKDRETKKNTSLAFLDKRRKSVDDDDDSASASGSVNSSASRIRRRHTRRNLRKTASSPLALASMRRELATMRAKGAEGNNEESDDKPDEDEEGPLPTASTKAKRKSNPETKRSENKLERSRSKRKPGSTNSLAGMRDWKSEDPEKTRDIGSMRNKQSSSRRRSDKSSKRSSKSPRRTLTEGDKSSGRSSNSPRRTLTDQGTIKSERSTRGRSSKKTDNASSHKRESQDQTRKSSSSPKRGLERNESLVSKRGLGRESSSRSVGSSKRGSSTKRELSPAETGKSRRHLLARGESSRSAGSSKRAISPRRTVSRDETSRQSGGSKRGLSPLRQIIQDESNRSSGGSKLVLSPARQLIRDESSRSVGGSKRVLSPKRQLLRDSSMRLARDESVLSRQPSILLSLDDSIDSEGSSRHRGGSVPSIGILGVRGTKREPSSHSAGSGGDLSRQCSDRSIDSSSTLDTLETAHSGQSLALLSSSGDDPVERRPTTQSICSNSLLDTCMCPDSPASTASEMSQDLLSAPNTPNHLTPTKKQEQRRSGQESTIDSLAIPDIVTTDDDRDEEGDGCSACSKHSEKRKKKRSKAKRCKTMNSPRCSKHDGSPTSSKAPDGSSERRIQRSSKHGRRGHRGDKPEKTLQGTIMALHAISKTSVVIDPETRKVVLKRCTTIE